MGFEVGIRFVLKSSQEPVGLFRISAQSRQGLEKVAKEHAERQRPVLAGSMAFSCWVAKL